MCHTRLELFKWYFHLQPLKHFDIIYSSSCYTNDIFLYFVPYTKLSYGSEGFGMQHMNDMVLIGTFWGCELMMKVCSFLNDLSLEHVLITLVNAVKNVELIMCYKRWHVGATPSLSTNCPASHNLLPCVNYFCKKLIIIIFTLI